MLDSPADKAFLIQQIIPYETQTAGNKKPPLVLPLAVFVGRARFFARHDVFNVTLFGVQNSVHTLLDYRQQKTAFGFAAGGLDSIA